MVTERVDALHVDLAGKLRVMLDLLPVERESTIHHLFGIRYAAELRDIRGGDAGVSQVLD